MKISLLFLLTLAISCFSEDRLALPATTNTIHYYIGFSLEYSEEHEQPRWVAYQLTADEVNNPVVDRNDRFRADPNIPTGSATLDDYKNSGFDRGHLCPAADMKWSNQSMDDCFYMTNMSPQRPEFNRGIWKNLEDLTRRWAVQNRAVYVVTGGVLKKGLPTIGINKVSIPGQYYKILLDYQEPEIKMIAFLLPNGKGTRSLDQYVVPTDSVEELTGIDFFPSLPDDIETALERSQKTAEWFNGVPAIHTPVVEKGTTTTTTTIQNESSDTGYWCTGSSNKRHNSSCRYYHNSKGYPCSKSTGVACQICGG